MSTSEVINIAAEHLWLHHRDIIEEHTDYITKLYYMYYLVERVCSRNNASNASIAKVSHMRRTLRYRSRELEETIDVKYR